MNRLFAILSLAVLLLSFGEALPTKLAKKRLGKVVSQPVHIEASSLPANTNRFVSVDHLFSTFKLGHSLHEIKKLNPLAGRYEILSVAGGGQGTLDHVNSLSDEEYGRFEEITQKRSKPVTDYLQATTLPRIGGGAFGTVFRARDKDDATKEYAIKFAGELNQPLNLESSASRLTNSKSAASALGKEFEAYLNLHRSKGDYTLFFVKMEAVIVEVTTAGKCLPQPRDYPDDDQRVQLFQNGATKLLVIPASEIPTDGNLDAVWKVLCPPAADNDAVTRVRALAGVRAVVMEWCITDLRHAIGDSRTAPEPKFDGEVINARLRVRFAADLLAGLHFMARRTYMQPEILEGANPPFVHRDLKPENVMIRALPGGNYRLVIADLGLVSYKQPATRVKNGDTDWTWNFGAPGQEVGWAGTATYSAPEKVHSAPFGSVDTYAAGIIIHELICGTRSDYPRDITDDQCEAATDALWRKSRQYANVQDGDTYTTNLDRCKPLLENSRDNPSPLKWVMTPGGDESMTSAGLNKWQLLLKGLLACNSEERLKPLDALAIVAINFQECEASPRGANPTNTQAVRRQATISWPSETVHIDQRRFSWRATGKQGCDDANWSAACRDGFVKFEDIAGESCMRDDNCIKPWTDTTFRHAPTGYRDCWKIKDEVVCFPSENVKQAWKEAILSRLQCESRIGKYIRSDFSLAQRLQNSGLGV